MSIFRGKKVLVAGGTGLIGRPLVELLVAQGASVRVASMDDPARAQPKADFRHLNLLDFSHCREACQGIDMVFNLLGVKGSPAAAARRPASFLVPTVVLSFNLLEAARVSGVERFLYTSSVGVYGPAEEFREADAWETPPSPHDRFAGWAKRMGELQVEAYQIEFGRPKVAIVRPANVYGPYDNFDPESAMVVPSLIRRALSGEDPIVVWGDGSPVRDFVHARDVARGMLTVMERLPEGPVNLGSGRGISVQELVKTVLECAEKKARVKWDPSGPSGDKRRVMDISRARGLGYEPEIALREGIRETVDWYRSSAGESFGRYDVFRSKGEEPLLL